MTLSSQMDLSIAKFGQGVTSNRIRERDRIRESHAYLICGRPPLVEEIS